MGTVDVVREIIMARREQPRPKNHGYPLKGDVKNLASVSARGDEVKFAGKTCTARLECLRTPPRPIPSAPLRYGPFHIIHKYYRS